MIVYYCQVYSYPAVCGHIVLDIVLIFDELDDVTTTLS